jgi:hypothetical protein
MMVVKSRKGGALALIADVWWETTEQERGDQLFNK